MVHDVALDRERVRITLLPTFVGGPALEMMRANAIREVSRATARGGVWPRDVPLHLLRPHLPQPI